MVGFAIIKIFYFGNRLIAIDVMNYNGDIIMSLLPVVNFINILCAHFMDESLFSSLPLITCKQKKLLKRLMYKKGVHKKLMKLTSKVVIFEKYDVSSKYLIFSKIYDMMHLCRTTLIIVLK